MNKKNIAVLSYVFLIGWIVAFVLYRNLPKTDQGLPVYHLKQSLILNVLGFVVGFVGSILAAIIPGLSIVMSIVGLAFIVLMVIGILNAWNEQEKPLPFIGNLFIEKIQFIN